LSMRSEKRQYTLRDRGERNCQPHEEDADTRPSFREGREESLQLMPPPACRAWQKKD
jgi:hypothetical protein